ncbi:MAG: S9 family peptidase, partial [Clostridia bacterium]|nr:S9 family peptidase [Clostridia bacterium]
MEKVVYSDLYKFNFLSDVVASPDGKKVIFTKTVASEEKNGYASEIWILDVASGEYKKLTNGGEERGGFWLDEKTVVFSGNRDKNADWKKASWMKISIDGGEAEMWMEIDDKIGMIKVIGGGKYLVTSSKNCEGEPEKKENCAQE